MANSKDDTTQLDQEQSPTAVDAGLADNSYPVGDADNTVGDADNPDNEAGTRQDEGVSSDALDPEADSIETGAAAGAAMAPLASPPAGKVKSGRTVAWLALLLALVAAAGSAYLAWLFTQQQERGRTLADMTEVNHQQIQQFQRSVEAAKNSVSEERSARQQAEARLQSALQEANASIDGHARRLLSLTATTTDDWRLAEVEYLLRLANQRIMTSKDGPTALNLLQAADQILLELGDPRLYSVREAIANDRAAISLVGQLDLDGVFLQLGALARQINQLPLLQVPEFAAVPVAAAPAVAGDASAEPAAQMPAWLASVQEIASSTWAELKSLVVIQRRDAAIKPLLPPEQQYYLRNNLRLLINQAQLALLDGRQLPYRESLTSAAAWLQESFPMQEPANQRVVKTLLELAALPVTAEYPDVSASVLAIKAFIAEQHRLKGTGLKGTGLKGTGKAA